MHGTLRFLAGNSVVELVLISWVFCERVPRALGDCRTAKDHVGSPLVGCSAIFGIRRTGRSIRESIGSQRLVGKGSGGYCDCRPQLAGRGIATEFAGSGAVHKRNLRFMPGREDCGGLEAED